MRLLCSAALLAIGSALLPGIALAADGSFERTLKVNGPVLLGIDTGSGNIHVSAGDVSSVHIVGHVHSSGGFFGGGSDSAEDRVKQVVNNPPINQAGNIISLGHNFHVNNVSIDYDIVTPRGTDLRADSGSGDIRVQDDGGPVQLKTGSGSLAYQGSNFKQISQGKEHLTGDASGGGAQVRASTGSGNIRVR